MSNKSSSFPTSQLGHLVLNHIWPIWLATLIILTGLVFVDLFLFGQAFGQLAIIAGMVGVAFILFIFLKPVFGLYLLVLSFFSLHWLTDSLQVLPKVFNFIPDVIIVTLFFRGVHRRLRRQGTLPRTPVDVFVLLFVIVAILSALLNHSDSVLVFLNGLFRQNIKFILLFYAIVYLAPVEKVLRQLIILFISLELVQIPITIVQALLYEDWDFVGGTLGFASTGILALSVLMVMALLFGFHQVTYKMKYVFLGLLLFIPAVLGEGKIVFVFGPMLILFLLSYRWAFLRARAVLLLIVFILAFGFSLFALDALLPQARSLQVLSSISFTLRSYERSLSATGGFPRSRLGDIQFTTSLLREDPIRMLVGHGPGSSSRAFAEIANGSLYRRFQVYEGPYFYFSFVQLSTTLLEYGSVGLLIYLLLLWRLYRWNSKFLRRASDRFWWAIAWGFRGVLFVFVASIVYWRVWSTEILASLFWMLAGVLWVQYTTEQMIKRSDSRFTAHINIPA